MAFTVCTVNNIILETITGGAMYKGGVDCNGEELPNIQVQGTAKDDGRKYFCNNCYGEWDGTETFEEVKKHLGTFPVDRPKIPFYN